MSKFKQAVDEVVEQSKIDGQIRVITITHANGISTLYVNGARVYTEMNDSGGQPHPDDVAVDEFAAVMKDKLAKKRAEGRGGWEDKSQCTAEFLSSLLREHVAKGDPVDVANLAMMLHQRGERVTVAEDSAKGAGDVALPNALYGRFRQAPPYRIDRENWRFTSAGNINESLRELSEVNTNPELKNYGMKGEVIEVVWLFTTEQMRAAVLADRQQRGGDVDERAAFEAWARRTSRRGNFDLRDGHGYADGYAHSDWHVWQARAALAANKADDARDAARFIKVVNWMAKHQPERWRDVAKLGGIDAIRDWVDSLRSPFDINERPNRGEIISIIREFLSAVDGLHYAEARKTWVSGFKNDMTCGERVAASERYRKARAAIDEWLNQQGK